MDIEKEGDLPYIITSIGISCGMLLAVYGACEGIVSAGTAAILCSQHKTMLGPAYFIIIMISTIFFSGFLLSLIVATNIKENLSLEAGISYFSACIMFGIVGAMSGKVCAVSGKHGFRVLKTNITFLPILMIIFGMVEFTVILVFSCALLMVYQQP